MQAADFEYIAAMLKRESGMHLSPEKTYLLESRLQPIARSQGFASIGELICHMRTAPSAKLTYEVTQAMTTNETMFFRDTKPFELLRDVMVPRMIERVGTTRPIRIWSAACSSGQEPYTIAMTLLEHFASANIKFEIVATDICEKTVNAAKEGVYSQFEVQRGLPIQMLIKYFEQLDGNRWKVKDALKKHISFDIHNLLRDASAFGEFDIVFCRNVLIYFDSFTKAQVLTRIAQRMHSGSFITLGVAETTQDSDQFMMVPEQYNLFSKI